VTHSAHVHAIAVIGQRGTPDANVRPGNEVGTEDIVVERISGKEASGDPETVREVFRALNYLLSHASPPEASPSVVTYAGALAPAASRRWTKLVDGDPKEEGTEAHDLTEAVDLLLDLVPGERGQDPEGPRGRCPCCDGTDWLSIWDVPNLLADRGRGPRAHPRGKPTGRPGVPSVRPAQGRAPGGQLRVHPRAGPRHDRPRGPRGRAAAVRARGRRGGPESAAAELI
jgi:hypothetical protein